MSKRARRLERVLLSASPCTQLTHHFAGFHEGGQIRDRWNERLAVALDDKSCIVVQTAMRPKCVTNAVARRSDRRQVRERHARWNVAGVAEPIELECIEHVEVEASAIERDDNRTCVANHAA